MTTPNSKKPVRELLREGLRALEKKMVYLTLVLLVFIALWIVGSGVLAWFRALGLYR